MENNTFMLLWVDYMPYYQSFWNFSQFQENQAGNSYRNSQFTNEPKRQIQSYLPIIEPQNDEEEIIQSRMNKNLKKEKKKKKNSDPIFSIYRPKKAMKKQKKYRDSKRNILPNIFNKIFTFLGSKFKSMELITKFLKNNSEAYEQNLALQYFQYQKELRTSLNKFLVREDFVNLFRIQKKFLYLFDEQTQIKLISISIYLLREYLDRNQFTISLFDSKRVNKNKIIDYLKYFRQVQEDIKQLSQKFILQYGSRQNKNNNYEPQN